MHTLKSLADFMGELDNRNEYERENLHSQLRHLQRNNLIRGTRKGAGRTSPLYLSPVEAAQARILITLSDVGLDVPALAEIAPYLDAPINFLGAPPPSARSRSGYIVSNGGLDDALRGIAAGEAWSLAIEFFRNQDGQRELQVNFDWPALDVEEPERFLHLGRGRKPVIKITVPLSNLLKPFAG